LLRIALAPRESAQASAQRSASGRTAVADPQARMPGRGAYLCRELSSQLPRAECLAEATRRSAIARTLRCTATLDPKLVESVSQ
jgi:predicted RNA-binding protein YlxR (DUF448 family)